VVYRLSRRVINPIVMLAPGFGIRPASDVLPKQADGAGPRASVRAAGQGGAGMVRIGQARATSMATGTGLVMMSRTGE
jgi:hypothetical protein